MHTGTDLGLYILERDIKLPYILLQNCSVFQDELMAILKDVSIIEWNIRSGQDVTINVDSKMALKALIKQLVKSRLVGDCKANLTSFNDRY